MGGRVLPGGYTAGPATRPLSLRFDALLKRVRLAENSPMGISGNSGSPFL